MEGDGKGGRGAEGSKTIFAQNRVLRFSAINLFDLPIIYFSKPLTLSYPGWGQNTPPLLFFLHHPKTAQGIKLKLCDFKDTPLRHILQVKPVR